MSSSNNNISYIPSQSAQLAALEKRRKELKAKRDEEDYQLTVELAREENRLAAERKRAEEARIAAEDARRKTVEEKMKQKETEKRKRAEEELGEADAGPSVPKRAKTVSNKKL